nr:unnamed protein product [Callosobruchus analis]
MPIVMHYTQELRPLRIFQINKESSVQNYLSEFGYLEKPKDGAFALRTESSVLGSLRRLQAFAGLPVTGQLDEATRNLMRRPRCGLPDEPRAVAEMDDQEGRHRHRRRRRFAIYGQKWPYTSLTWR